MKGHVLSRHSLGAAEGTKGNNHFAVKHYMISAKMARYFMNLFPV